MRLPRRLAFGLERTVYVVAGLPIAIRAAFTRPAGPSDELRHAFAWAFWHPRSIGGALELCIGLLLVPFAVPLAALWFTARNGSVVREREGKGVGAQFVEQLRLYVRAGILGPWYYILSLHRDGFRRAPTFLQRCETKRGIYALLKSDGASPLGDKAAFAERCVAAGIPRVPCELMVDCGPVDPRALPDCDLFAKPQVGCGGSGAERWDRVARRTWQHQRMVLGDAALVDHLREKGCAFIVQKRVRAHRRLQNVTSGALPTVRALTCLDERGKPELVAAVFRMSVGQNRTVDNIHAGGLACAISGDGSLGMASNLGLDARLGWCSDHPATGARVTGTRLPFWRDVQALALRAHRAFADRVLIGWDIAISDRGPVVIEGNRGPDLDLMQRFMDEGFCGHHRFSELLAFHVRARAPRREPAMGRSVVGVDA